jgi:hypothetical protein
MAFTTDVQIISLTTDCKVSLFPLNIKENTKKNADEGTKKCIPPRPPK